MIDSSTTQRRASVRQMDWRFLLPDPPGGAFEHLVLLGGSADLAERIIDSGVARRLSREVPRGRSADALVILRSASADLPETVRCLVPGGVLYYEVEQRRGPWSAATPGRTRHALRRSGLSPTGIYWARPGFDACQMYLPLDDAGAIRWFLDAKFVAATPRWRLLAPLLRAILRLGSGPFALLARAYAVTAVMGSAAGSAPSILGHPELPARLRDRPLRPLVLTAGDDDVNRVIILPFAPGASHPLAALKFSRLPSRNFHTENEQVVLAQVRRDLGGAMRGTIPEPLAILRWNGISVGVESEVPGRLLITSTGRWGPSLRRKIEDLHHAVDWLVAFHRQTRPDISAWQGTELLEKTEMLLAAYERSYGIIAGEERLFAAVRHHTRSLVGIPLPRVWEHYAYADWNIYRADHATYVVDWEGGEIGLPLCDLLYLVTHWTYNVRHLFGKAAQVQGFRDLFCRPGYADPAITAGRQAITDYMARLEIDRRFLPLLLVLMWVVHALGRVDREEALGGRETDLRSGNSYVGYIGVLAESVDSLFAGHRTDAPASVPHRGSR